MVNCAREPLLEYVGLGERYQLYQFLRDILRRSAVTVAHGIILIVIAFFLCKSLHQVAPDDMPTHKASNRMAILLRPGAARCVRHVLQHGCDSVPANACLPVERAL